MFWLIFSEYSVNGAKNKSSRQLNWFDQLGENQLSYLACVFYDTYSESPPNNALSFCKGTLNIIRLLFSLFYSISPTLLSYFLSLPPKFSDVISLKPNGAIHTWNHVRNLIFTHAFNFQEFPSFLWFSLSFNTRFLFKGIAMSVRSATLIREVLLKWGYFEWR